MRPSVLLILFLFCFLSYYFLLGFDEWPSQVMQKRKNMMGNHVSLINLINVINQPSLCEVAILV